jgi:hypothetical protein
VPRRAGVAQRRRRPTPLRVRSGPVCSTFKDIEFVEEAYELKGREQHESTAMPLGRASYEALSKVWPDLTEFADGIQKLVTTWSTSLRRDSGGCTN